MASSPSSGDGPTRVASGSTETFSLSLSLSRRKGENPDDQHGGRRGSRRGEKMARSGKGVGGSSNVPVFTASQNNRVKENARVNATREWDSQTQYCKTSHRSTARSSLANDGSSE